MQFGIQQTQLHKAFDQVTVFLTAARHIQDSEPHPDVGDLLAKLYAAWPAWLEGKPEYDYAERLIRLPAPDGRDL